MIWSPSCFTICCRSSVDSDLKLGGCSKSGIQMELAFFMKAGLTRRISDAKRATVGFDFSTLTQWFSRRKWRKPQKLISRMKLSLREKGVMTIMRLLLTEKRASAAAMAEHVFPEPRPWYTRRPRYGEAWRTYSRTNF